MTTTDTPRTDAARFEALRGLALRQDCIPLKLGQELELELLAAQAEVERLTGRMKEAEDLIKGLHDGWKKARKAHLATCKNAQAEIDKLYTENVCLQELIQEFYE
jgi:hypothetical protein